MPPRGYGPESVEGSVGSVGAITIEQTIVGDKVQIIVTVGV